MDHEWQKNKKSRLRSCLEATFVVLITSYLTSASYSCCCNVNFFPIDRTIFHSFLVLLTRATKYKRFVNFLLFFQRARRFSHYTSTHGKTCRQRHMEHFFRKACRWMSVVTCEVDYGE